MKKNINQNSGRSFFKSNNICIALLVILFLMLFHPSVKAHLCGVGCTSPLDASPLAFPEQDFPCLREGGGKDPEFHSLRPYQAANCGDSDKTRFCFNNYVIAEQLNDTYDPHTCFKVGGAYSCAQMPPRKIEKIYTIDGEYARFPIMGNTEQVTNSQGP